MGGPQEAGEAVGGVSLHPGDSSPGRWRDGPRTLEVTVNWLLSEDAGSLGRAPARSLRVLSPDGGGTPGGHEERQQRSQGGGDTFKAFLLPPLLKEAHNV